jgi:hypothetical protein
MTHAWKYSHFFRNHSMKSFQIGESQIRQPGPISKYRTGLRVSNLHVNPIILQTSRAWPWVSSRAPSLIRVWGVPTSRTNKSYASRGNNGRNPDRKCKHYRLRKQRSQGPLRTLSQYKFPLLLKGNTAMEQACGFCVQQARRCFG